MPKIEQKSAETLCLKGLGEHEVEVKETMKKEVMWKKTGGGRRGAEAGGGGAGFSVLRLPLTF